MAPQIWLSCIPAILVGTLACGVPKDDRTLKALSVENGMTEKQVTVIAGQPSRTVAATDLCKRDGGVREMIYDDLLVDRLGLLPDQVIGATTICLNASSIVVAKTMVEY